MNTLSVWWDGAAGGAANMAADECLADVALQRDGLCVRFYGWDTTTVSLGAFQRVAESRACVDIAGLPLVRRPSGGGAIVHGSDLTYAAAVPKRHPWGATPQTLYDALHGAMVSVLREHRIDARLCQSGTADGEGAPFFCFDRRSPGDVVVERDGGTTKLMGSAQRRLAAAVLQHGSLLLRVNRQVGAAAHLGIAELGAEALASDPRHIAAAWLERVAAVLDARVEMQGESWARMVGDAAAAGRQRFADERWTCRR